MTRIFLAVCVLAAAAVMAGCSQANTPAFISNQISAEQNAMKALLTSTTAAFNSGQLKAASEKAVLAYESDAVTGINAALTAYKSGNYSLAATDIAQASAVMSSLAPQLAASPSASSNLALAQASLKALSGAIPSKP